MDVLKMRARERARLAQDHGERERIASAVRAGLAAPKDRFGQAIREGAQVLFFAPMGLVYHVAAVTPILDPRLPPGLVQVRLAVEIEVPVQLGQPRADMIAVNVRPAPAEVVATDGPPSGPEDEEPPQAPEDPGAGA